MTMRTNEQTRSVRILSILAALTLFASGAAAQTPVAAPDVPRGKGVLALAAETSLVIRGVPGHIVVTAIPARELRFSSQAKDRSGSERPISVSSEGTTVTIGPAPGGTLPDGILRVDAPAALSVRVEAEGGKVLVDGFGGAVSIVGKGTVATAQALRGTLDAEIEGGSLGVTNLAGAATVRLRAASALTAKNLRGPLNLDSQGATFKVQELNGACRVEARGGSGDLVGLAGGGDVRVSETPLRLTAGRGDLSVTSDAAVTFTNMAGSLRFDMEGGTLRGQGCQGSLRVRTNRTDVALSGISGDADLDITRGKLAVQRASSFVGARIFAGDARFLELQGPLRLVIDGGSAEVSWVALAPKGDSELKNNGGDISVRFPPGASGRVSARSTSGKVTSELPSIHTAEAATEVEGKLGDGNGPRIVIEADGNIRLSGGGPAPAAAPAAPAS